MLTTSLLLAATFLPQGGGSPAPAVINEFSYDDSSTDDLEFIELYNRSGAPLDIGDWRVRSEDPSGVNFDIAIPTGTILAAGDFWVLGQTAVPNVDQPLTGSLENSEESIELYDAAGTLVDTLVYESNKGLWNPALAEGEGVWGNATLIEGNNPMSWSRVRDGYDSDNNGNDFRQQLWTPGTSNNRPALADVTENFDALTVGNDVPGWTGSFVNPRVIDPTLVDGNNPNAIPASPQGGNAALAWDPSGGGNAAAFDTLPSSASGFEAFVYFDAAATPAGEYENWSVGFGTCGTFYNSPDPAGTFGFTANGLTGVAWTFQRTETGGALYLVDHNDGGWGAGAISGPTVLGQILLTPGVDDGWQRLSLEVVNGRVEARFGGTYGQPDGTLFTGTVVAVPRGLHVGYREFLVDNTTARPVTFDAARIWQCPMAGERYFGNPLASSGGLTAAIAAGPLAVGTSTSLEVTSLLPSSTAFVLLGLERAAPLSFGALAPAGFEIWVDAFGDLILPTDAAGAASFPLNVPADLSLCGAELSFQAFQADPGYAAFPIPAFHTDGLALTIGS